MVKPLGEVSDYFWRVEFQQRGSLHIHALLWIKNAPDILQLTESVIGRMLLAHYVDSIVSVLAKTSKELDICSCLPAVVIKVRNLLSCRQDHQRVRLTTGSEIYLE